MPRNGSGTYVPPASTWNPAVPDTVITSEDWNSLRDDMVAALTQSLASDGQTTASQMIPFAAGIRVSSGDVATPSITFTGDLDTGLYRSGANAFSIVAGGTAVANITASGVTFPLALTVSGNTTIGSDAADTLTVNATTTFVGPVTLPDDTVTNAKLAEVATATIKGRVTAGTGNPEDLSATQATSILNAMVGDSGSGGTKGLVPAPATGDAAARASLYADGTWKADERKAWGVFTGSTGATVAARNLLCTRTSASNFSLTFTTGLANANYAIFVTPYVSGSGSGLYQVSIGSKNAAGFTIQVLENNGGSIGGIDPTEFSVMVLA